MPLILDGTTGIVANNIADYAISTAKLANSAITVPKIGYSGAVLQVVQTTTAATITTSSTSFVTTGIAQSITPSSTSSKIMACINGGGVYMQTSAQTTMRVTIYRGGTDLSAGYGVSNNGMMRFSTPGGSWSLMPLSMMWLDSPATTTSTTYTVYFRNSDSAASVEFSNTDRGVVTLTLMEIAG
jgi:hypothetical protein